MVKSIVKENLKSWLLAFQSKKLPCAVRAVSSQAPLTCFAPEAAPHQNASNLRREAAALLPSSMVATNWPPPSDDDHV